MIEKVNWTVSIEILNTFKFYPKKILLHDKFLQLVYIRCNNLTPLVDSLTDFYIINFCSGLALNCIRDATA